MLTAMDVITYVEIALFVLIIGAFGVYSIPIILVPRFHKHYNILTLNLALAFLSCVVYWFIYILMIEFDRRLLFQDSTCTFSLYMQVMCVCQASFASNLISIHQLCHILYPSNPFFKSNTWIILGITGQWIFGCLVAIPGYLRQPRFCAPSIIAAYYKPLISTVFPCLISFFVYMTLFSRVRASTRRLHPRTPSSQSTSIQQQHPRISRRDAHLLKHMIFIFALFIVGWCPVNFLSIINYYQRVNELISAVLVLFAQIASLCMATQLFMYNEELRLYLRAKLCACF